MNRTVIRILQRTLATAGLYRGDIDGLRGPATNAAVRALIDKRSDELATSPATWSDHRKSVACLQLGCADANLAVGPIDGLWGPLTDNAVDELEETQRTGHPPRLWRDEVPVSSNPNNWPSEFAIEDHFGAPCEVPLVSVECPWQLIIDWNPAQRTRAIRVHEKVADSLSRILQRAHDHYGDAELRRLGLHRYGGSYNCRKKRGGSSWSTHAWGIAIDWYPSRNKLRWGRDRATLASTECIDWWRIWEEEGWVSLGRCRNFDWMHVQAAQLD